MKEWIFTTDHKRVGILYLFGSLAAFVVAGTMALLIRTELMSVGPTVTEDPNVYNVWLYFHGAAMILGFQIPALTGFLANWAAPIMLGAPDMAFPRVNALSVWLYWVGILLALATFVVPDSPDVMWTGYPPYAVTTETNTALYSLTVIIMGFSSIVGGINLMCTVFFCRAKGMQYNQFNIFVWTTMAANVLQLVFIPVLGSAVMLLMFDKYLGTNFFNPAGGGDVLIYENLFWFYSHPAVYVILLPFLGITYEMIATFAKNRIFFFFLVVYPGVWGVALLSTDVWVHHAYAAGLPDYIRMAQTITTLLISVPVGLLMIGLVATMWNGAIFLFLIGGLTGIPNAMASVDHGIHDSYFIMAHFHYVMALAGTSAIFGSIYYYFPKMTGKMYKEGMAKIGFWLFFIGVNMVFFPLFEIGIEGMPRRYYDYSQFPQFEGIQHFATIGAYVLATGVAINFITWIHGWVAGEKVDNPNPWGSKSLEFTDTDVIPGPGNFKVQPVISPEWSPYNYGGTTKHDDV